jgi:hypothetical protein
MHAAWSIAHTRPRLPHYDPDTMGRNQPVRVEVNDRMQHGYVYHLTEPAGRNFHRDFRPNLTPKQMLALGVFGGKYLTDCTAEFPADWFEKAKLCPDRHDPGLNYFGVSSGRKSQWKFRPAGSVRW